MSERKRAKESWDKKMREHKGSTSEADYLYAAGKYDKPLPSALDVRREGKPSIFNGRKHKNTTGALAIVALMSGYNVENSLSQGPEETPSVGEVVQTEISSIGNIVLSGQATIHTAQTNFEDMVANLLVPEQTIVIQHAPEM